MHSPDGWEGMSTGPAVGPQQTHEQTVEGPNCQKKKKLKMNPHNDSKVDDHSC